MPKAIIIGASSGIGRELAKVLAKNGYSPGLVGRRIDLLVSLQQELAVTSFTKQIDVSQPSEAMPLLKELIHEMNGVDLVVISSGVGFINTDLEWEKERETISVNVTGFAAVANVAMEHFISQGSGHLVGISSVAALRGSESCPAYAASKAFVSNYLEGLRKKAVKLKLPIIVTEVMPGFVDTAMAQGDGQFWVASAEKAAEQIFRVIRSRKSHACVTRRWRMVACFLKVLPDFIYLRI
ncbi:MAG: SDR family NAD(P)-dependent oxidoreductase [Chlorobium sp.]|nr:MAG: SDR family NAD(P)-dependent oxidoreductase [Chlorobium sp.]